MTDPTPPRADLRTLAFEAIWNDGMGPVMSPEDLADAVLAAVLPEYRRMVLTEAADLAESMVKTWPGMGDQAKAGNEHLRQAARRIRALAAAAPPAGLSATVPAGAAPAVPEEADGQRAGEGEPADAAWVIVRSLARGAPLAALFRRQGPLWYRDGSGAAFEWGRLVDMDETHSPVRMVPAADTDRLARELHESRTRLATYENTITWNTTCHNCATVLDSSIRETDRAEKAEADRDRLAAQVERVRALHAPKPCPKGCDHCAHCGTKYAWPCPTIAAVDALPDAGTDQTEDDHG